MIKEFTCSNKVDENPDARYYKITDEKGCITKCGFVNPKSHPMTPEQALNIAKVLEPISGDVIVEELTFEEMKNVKAGQP